MTGAACTGAREAANLSKSSGAKRAGLGESEGVVLDDRRLMIPPEIKHRRSREREVEVRHPFAHTSCHHKPRFRNMRRTRSAYPVANGGGLVTITAT